MTKNIKEFEDNSIAAVIHQGKSIAEWEKLLKGFGFTQSQILAMVRSGQDLDKLLQVGLDEADKDINDKQLFKGEEFFFENEDEADALDESIAPEDVVTVGDFVELLRKNTQFDDKLVFRCDKKEKVLFDVVSKAGTTIVDVLDSNTKILENENEGETKVNEGRSWYGGGYGGTGRSYRRLGDQAPRGAEIGWYPVEVLDPKAKGKMKGWRAGPSNFSGFDDELYGDTRCYKKGTMVMRNKYVKAGSESGVIQIALPSYFDCIKNNDEEGIKLLNMLGIPLDLTFGLDPNDDYSMTYTLR